MYEARAAAVGSGVAAMGKNDFMTPKGIANAAKAKGLQKLRFYCQPCQKQCRDENGFKCHCTSEAHLRQMEIFGQNQGRFISGYSEEFQKDFLNLMAISHRNSRVAANVVYNEYIANKQHVHMNSTRWTTLTEFIKHLGREGICVIDETPKGWFITYRPEDKEEMMRQASMKKRERATEEEEERNARLIREQIARATRDLPESARVAAAATELVRDDAAAALKLSISNKRAKMDATKTKTNALSGASALEAFGNDQRVASNADAGPGGSSTTRGGSGKASALDDIMRQELAKSTPAVAGSNPAPGPGADADAPWLAKGIVVKILSPALKSEGLYKKKASVRKLVDGGFVAELETLDAGVRVRVDQAELETVLPSVGGTVEVLRGAHRGIRGTLEGLDEAKFAARVTLREGPSRGEAMAFPYEDVSKVASK